MSKELQVGQIVKANPFRRDDAIKLDCILFDGEREVESIFRASVKDACKVIGSNNWLRENLLIKGIDYDA